MLDVTTNQNTNCPTVGGMISSGIDEDMDPLFDNDWLHQHNLDILFDLFEEEMEKKGLDAASSNSTTIFGTSPVTSYLFGTSPTLTSALDIYDLLYFDNQQQQQLNNNPTQLHQQQQQTNFNGSLTNSTNNSTTNNQQANTTVTYNVNEIPTNSCNIHHNRSRPQVSQNISTNHIANSITNAMRIKRKFKKGQSEGISLLARPLPSNTSDSGCINRSVGSSNNNINLINKNNSDKTSTKLTNLTTNIIGHSNCVSGGIDINQSKQSHHNRNKHLHRYHHQYVTGCAVIREHAYAVRGH